MGSVDHPTWQGGAPTSLCQLYQANAVDLNAGTSGTPTGNYTGYQVLLETTGADGAAFAQSLGLPHDGDLTSNTGPVVPDLPTNIAWAIDNGSYLLDGLPPSRCDDSGSSSLTAFGYEGKGSACDTFYIANPNFNPLSPLTRPNMFFGVGADRWSALIHSYGTGLLLAVKTLPAFATTITLGLNVIAAAGLGGISELAAGMATALGVATSSTTSLAAGASAIATAPIAVAAQTGAVAASTAVTGTTATLAATLGAALSSGGLAAVAGGALFGVIAELVTAFPAESPSLHVTSLPPTAVFVITYLDGGSLKYNVFNDPYHIVSVANSGPYLPNVQNNGTTASLSQVDAETFFAGLVYLNVVELKQDPPTTLVLAWTARVSQAGFLAFRAARAAGQSISMAILAAAPFALPTPFERKLQQIAPTPIPITQESNALHCLAYAHNVNETRIQNYLASDANQARDKSILSNAAISTAGGLGGFHLNFANLLKSSAKYPNVHLSNLPKLIESLRPKSPIKKAAETALVLSAVGGATYGLYYLAKKFLL